MVEAAEETKEIANERPKEEADWTEEMWKEELDKENSLTAMDRYSKRISEHNPITPAE